MKNLNNFFNFKNNKGSATLFVLIAVTFFTIVLFNLYTSNMNKLSAQDKEIEQIRLNYNSSFEKF